MNRDIVNRLERRSSVVLFIIGLALCVFALAAELLGLDITPGFGMVQMLQLLIGISFLTLAGYVRIHSYRPPGAPRSLQADIGVRLGATGLVFAYTTGWADLIGIGTHVDPAFDRPYVGPLQLGGLLVGILMIAAGVILYYTSRGARPSSSLGKLIPGGIDGD